MLLLIRSRSNRAARTQTKRADARVIMEKYMITISNKSSKRSRPMEWVFFVKLNRVEMSEKRPDIKKITINERGGIYLTKR